MLNERLPVRGARTRASQKAAIDHLRGSDPILRRVIDGHPGFDPRAWLAELPRMDAFGTLLFQLAGQQLSVQSTRSILRRLSSLFGGRLPSPREVLQSKPESLLKTGLSHRKIATLREVARQFSQGRLSEAGLRRLSDREVEDRLTEIRGVGPWTAHGFLIIALRRPDVVLPGDLALRKVIRRAYGLRQMPSQERVLQIAEPWKPYRSLATSYLFQAAFDSPSQAAGRKRATQVR